MLLDVSVGGGLEGYIAGVAGALDFSHQRLKVALEGLTPEQLVKVPAGVSNSIATLVVHVCAVEVKLAYMLQRQEIPANLKAAYLLDQPQNPLPVAVGETVESLSAKLGESQEVLVGALRQLNGVDLERKVPFGNGSEVTLRWFAALFPNHASQHLGQIQIVKKLLG